MQGQSHPRVGQGYRRHFIPDGRLTAASRVAYAARAAKILALRLAGLTEEQIGLQVELSSQSVHRSIRASMKKQTRGLEADQLRALELDRLDRLQQAIWTAATGTGKGIEKLVNLKAVDRILRIMERRASLLGLDQQQTTSQAGEIRLTLEQLVIQSGLGAGPAPAPALPAPAPAPVAVLGQETGQGSPGGSERPGGGGPSSLAEPISGAVTHKDAPMGPLPEAVPDAEFSQVKDPPEKISQSGEEEGPEPFTEEEGDDGA